MDEPKTFVFRYDDDVSTDEEQTDLSGSVPIPKVHDLLYRNGRTWMVTQVKAGYGKAIPVIHVFLADNSSRGPKR
jgi:hypothetical protein